MNAFKTTIKWIIAIVAICVIAVFLMSVNGLNVSRTFATIGEKEVTEAEFKYYLEIAKSEMLSEAQITDEAQQKEFWKSDIDGKKAADVAKEKALEALIRTQTAVMEAEKAGISLTDAEKSSASATIKGADSETKEIVDALKKSTGASEQELIKIMENEALSNKLYQQLATKEESGLMPSEEESKAKIAESYARVKHVLILNTPEEQTAEDGSVIALTEEDTAAYAKEAKKTAEEVLKKAVSGSDFEALIAEYGEDPGMESSPEGYIIDETGMSYDGSGMMVEEFTKGSFAVKAGEVNPELVESSYGWHIIKRYEVDPASESYTSLIAQVESTLAYENYEAYLDGLKDGLNISIVEKVLSKIKVK